MRLPSCGRTCTWTVPSFVLILYSVDNYVMKRPPERQAQERYQQFNFLRGQWRSNLKLFSKNNFIGQLFIGQKRWKEKIPLTVSFSLPQKQKRCIPFYFLISVCTPFTFARPLRADRFFIGLFRLSVAPRFAGQLLLRWQQNKIISADRFSFAHSFLIRWQKLYRSTTFSRRRVFSFFVCLSSSDNFSGTVPFATTIFFLCLCIVGQTRQKKLLLTRALRLWRSTNNLKVSVSNYLCSVGQRSGF